MPRNRKGSERNSDPIVLSIFGQPDPRAHSAIFVLADVWKFAARVWTHAEWDALPEECKPDDAVRIGTLGWIELKMVDKPAQLTVVG
jgi:hypothetical protein